MDIHISLNGASITLTPEQQANLNRFVQVMLFGKASKAGFKKVLGSRVWTKGEKRVARKLKAQYNGRVPKREIEALANKLNRTATAVSVKMHQL